MRSPRISSIVFAIAAVLFAALLIAPPAGARQAEPLVRDTTGTFYLVYGGERHATDRATIMALGLQPDHATLLAARYQPLLPEGSALPRLQNGAFITDPSGQRYLLFDGLHLIPDEDTFTTYGWRGAPGFDPAPLTTLDPELLRVLPRAAPLAPATRTANPNRFDWGYCTWWVAQRREVPWLGNADEWYANAQEFGFAVGDVPVPGAILVRRSASWSGYGHVAYVESVNGTSFTVSEMNVNAVGELTTATYDVVSNPPPGVIGYVYWRYDTAAIAPPADEPGRSGQPGRH